MGIEIENRQITKDRERIEEVLKLLRKQSPLSIKQEKFCNDVCVERFLKTKGENVKKAAKHLRLVLSWRESLGTDHLIADEFSGELAEGLAYVAGHDDDARPVVVFRIKQDYPKLSQKSFVRLLVFTLEVAVSSMSRFVDQFVLLFDASFFRSGSAFLNFFRGTLKIVADYYPGRLFKAFVIDPPSMFSVLWKGVRPFVEMAPVTAVVSSLDYEDSLEGGGGGGYTDTFRTASLRFESPAASLTGKPNPAAVGSASSRFTFTVSNLNSVKPWYLSTNPAPAGHSSRSVVVPTESSPSLIGESPLNARSYSFASPGARPTPLRQPTPLHRTAAPKQHPRTPKPSFLQSPANLFSFRKDGQLSKTERERESFLPFLRFYRRQYDEMVYRAKMRPPLGGLTSIVYSNVKNHQIHQHQRQQHSQSQSHRFTSHMQRI